MTQEHGGAVAQTSPAVKVSPPPPDRCRCLVIGCRRTTGKLEPTYPWICGVHWRLVPKWMKARRTRLYRIWKKAGGNPNGQDEPPRARRAVRAYWRWWNKIAAKAIERAMGITA